MNIQPLKHVALAATTCAALISLSATQAFAGPCDGMDKQLADISAEIDKICKNPDQLKKLGINDAQFCNNPKAADAAKFTKEVVGIWNKLAGNTAAKIGARQYSIGSGGNGTIQSTQRLWVSDSIAASDTITVRVNETDGQARMNVNVCVLKPGQSKATLKQQVVFNDTKDEKNNKKESKTINVSGTKGHIVIVKFSSANATANKFTYNFTVK